MDNSKQDTLINKIFFNKYKLERKLGEGSFGRIYLCINIKTNEKFAIKIENKSDNDNLLESEACILSYLKGPGIPFVKSYGASGNTNLLVMELLGSSLEDLFNQQNNKFGLKTVCMLAIQMLERIEYIHNKHIVHRDIKPDNFIMGLENNSATLYLIDFGLSKKYRSSKTLLHYEIKNNKKLTGTARYASINALMGVEQSRRDDLEAIGYVLLYFLRGSLPWQGLKLNKNEDRYKKIYEKKLRTSAEDLCKGFPVEFNDYVTYTKNLQYEQDPDYEFLKSLFYRILKDKNYENDYIFDWIKKSNSPKTYSTMVPNYEVLNKEEFKLNVSDEKNKITFPKKAENNNQTANNVTNNEVNHAKVKKEEDSDKNKKYNLNNVTNTEQMTSTQFKIGNNNTGNHDSVKEIQKTNNLTTELEVKQEKRKRANSKGCCFA